MFFAFMELWKWKRCAHFACEKECKIWSQFLIKSKQFTFLFCRFINWQVDAIRQVDPQALVTAGSWEARDNVDKWGGFNLYKDECLVKAGGKKMVISWIRINAKLYLTFGQDTQTVTSCKTRVRLILILQYATIYWRDICVGFAGFPAHCWGRCHSNFSVATTDVSVNTPTR